MALSETTDAKALMEANGGVYDIEQDPLWNGEQRNSVVPPAFGRKEMAFYQCDHLGTPQELTDHEGVVAWSAQYKAWGEAREAREAISEAGRRAGVRNPIRFQGQYFDEETGLHYNRFRYFDPVSGQFVSEDPIKLKGGLNLRLYAPNAVQWVDPLGLAGYTAKSNTAGTDTLSRGVHVNVHGPSLPQTPGGAHIKLLPTANGLGVVPTEGSAAETADLSEKQWKKVCACVIGHLDDPKNVGRLSKQAQSGMDTYPGTPRAGELAKVKEILDAHQKVGTNPAR